MGEEEDPIIGGALVDTNAGKEALSKGISNLERKVESPHIDPLEIVNKTPGQIESLAKDKGLIPKGTDPKSGEGSYIDPETGKQRILCHTNCPSPHGHINNPQGERLDINGNVVSPESPEAHLPIKLP